MIDITPIVNALMAVIVVLITVYLIPWIKSRTTEQQRQEINAWVKIAVMAAEQLYKGAGQGKQKKQYVLDFLAGKGLTLDMDMINNMIEAAVLEINKEVM